MEQGKSKIHDRGLNGDSSQLQGEDEKGESTSNAIEGHQVKSYLIRVKGAYEGLGASLFGTTVSQGVYFYFYSLLRTAFVHRRKKKLKQANEIIELRVPESLAIASLAGMANVLLTNPIWMVATRIQTYRNHSVLLGELDHGSPSTASVIKSIFQEYGVSGFWNGVGASLIMVINPTIQYAIYEWLMTAQRRLMRQQKRKASRPSTLRVFMISALAKAGATVLTYPMLTVKTRMMSARKQDADLQYTSILDAVTQIMKKEGLGGYYRGMNTKITQSILGAAVLLVCKEKITEVTKDIFERINA